MKLADNETAIITNIIALDSILFKIVEATDEAIGHLANKDLTIRESIDTAIGAILDLEPLLENALCFYKAALFLRYKL
ncbi:MAG: hypothetical protein KME46_22000 [Brasilonema angustatum HA4187-MV1]|jgi:hypothetical protein|nr:hypothetical protein [Brasilonema angustatum HA4187-MV1]